MKYISDTGRFKFVKDVSCDLAAVKRRVQITKNSGVAILNANAAIAWEAMKAGGRRFNGVNLNMQTDLYKWLYTKWEKYPEVAKELSVFLVMSACTESYGYPVLAKLYQKRIGNLKTIVSRSYAGNVFDKVWGFEPILNKFMEGCEF